MMLAHWAGFNDDEKLQMLDDMVHDVQRVSHLLDELLEGARLEPGPVRLARQPTDMASVARRAVRSVQAIFPMLEASIEAPEGLPALSADPFQLEQVVANLVENACKYGAATGLRIAISCCDGAQGGEVAVTVRDPGPGIAPRDLPHITEKFYRSPDNGPGGLGLGLWISMGIVEAHGGRLRAESRPGEGTAVTFTIPLRAPAPNGKLAGS
jgi:signal transduction histidine kinase